MKTPFLIAMLTLGVAFLAEAQEHYLFVDQNAGVTNGPFTVSPYAEVQLDGKTYTLFPADPPFEFESRVVPIVDARDAKVEDVLTHALAAAGVSNRSAEAVVLFHADMITNRVTFSARRISLGELVKIVSSICDLSIVRQRSRFVYQPKETIILRPASLPADQTTEVFGMPPKVYDGLVKEYGSFTKFLMEFGVIRDETTVTHEYDRTRSLLLLHAPRETLQAFHNTL